MLCSLTRDVEADGGQMIQFNESVFSNVVLNDEITRVHNQLIYEVERGSLDAVSKLLELHPICVQEQPEILLHATCNEMVRLLIGLENFSEQPELFTKVIQECFPLLLKHWPHVTKECLDKFVTFKGKPSILCSTNLFSLLATFPYF